MQPAAANIFYRAIIPAGFSGLKSSGHKDLLFLNKKFLEKIWRFQKLSVSLHIEKR
jgi:hypothetical protein